MSTKRFKPSQLREHRRRNWSVKNWEYKEFAPYDPCTGIKCQCGLDRSAFGSRREFNEHKEMCGKQ